MSRPRFLADQDFRHPIIDGLMRAEPTIDLRTVRSVGMATSPDPELLEYAAREVRTILTHDVNTMVGFAYGRVKAGLPMAGLIAVPQRLPARVAIDQLLMIWSASEAEELRHEVIYLPL